MYWPGGVRCESGVSPVCGVYMEQEKAACDKKTLSQVAGGPVRSSAETAVMVVERRGRVVRDVFIRSTKTAIAVLGGI